MAQDATALRNKRIAMRQQKYGITSKEAKSNVWDDWSGRGFHVSFAANEAIPLQQEDILGSGSSGIVYKTICKGVALAWKSQRIPRSGELELREIDNLKKLDHHHIIKLMGSFTHHQNLNLLLWPVAVCDLATFLSDLDIFKTHRTLMEFRKSNPIPISRFKELGIGVTTCSEARESARQWLYQKFGCLADVIAYLHRNDIKHKDLKPSNILLSGKGLWLTDFGTSGEFSTLPSSQSNNGERGTPIYFAPEVASHQLSGRSADIFSLGCVFMEMFWASCMPEGTREDLKGARSGGDRSFQANLDSIRRECVLNILSITNRDYMAAQHLLPLISQMLHPNPETRPLASDVRSQLVLIDGLRKEREWSLHSNCCQPGKIRSKQDWNELSQLDWAEVKRSLGEKFQPFMLLHPQPPHRNLLPRHDVNPTNYQTSLTQLQRSSPSERQRETDPSDQDSSVSASPVIRQEDGFHPVAGAAEPQAEVGNDDEPEAPSPQVQAGQDQVVKSPRRQFSSTSADLDPFEIVEHPVSNGHQVTRLVSGPDVTGSGTGVEYQRLQAASGDDSAADLVALPSTLQPSMHHPEHPESSFVELNPEARIPDAQSQDTLIPDAQPQNTRIPHTRPSTTCTLSSKNPFRKNIGQPTNDRTTALFCGNLGHLEEGRRRQETSR